MNKGIVIDALNIKLNQMKNSLRDYLNRKPISLFETNALAFNYFINSSDYSPRPLVGDFSHSVQAYINFLQLMVNDIKEVQIELDEIKNDSSI